MEKSTSLIDHLRQRETMLHSFYLDWTNEWLTVGSMAEWYGISEKETNIRIELGRKVHGERVNQLWETGKCQSK